MPNTFCSTIHKRPGWEAVVPALLKAEPGNWRESTLGTHDIAIRPSEGRKGERGAFRFVLLSAADVESPDAWTRLERLYHSDGGRNCAAVFLLRPQDEGHGIVSFTRFQLSMTERFAMPILPLTSVDDLANTLSSFCSQLSGPPSSSNLVSPPPTQALLPHCTNGSPLSPGTTSALSDVNSGFSDLLDKIAEPEGRMMLEDYVGDDAERVIRFWTSDDAMC